MKREPIKIELYDKREKATTSKFRILTSFKISGRGLAIVGDILEGEIQKGNWIAFRHNEITIKKEIGAIEMVDKITEKIAHIGILLKYENEEEKEEFSQYKLEEQIVEIEK